MALNKRVTLAVVFLVAIIIGLCLSIRDRTIDTPYQYPVTPGSEEWAEFNSRTEMVNACQIPQDILERLSTDALLQTILDYPFLSEMTMLYWNENESEEVGFWHIASTFNGLTEFMKREDAIETLKQYGSFSDLESNSHVLTIIYRSVLDYQELLAESP